jgi:hypothetical protein
MTDFFKPSTGIRHPEEVRKRRLEGRTALWYSVAAAMREIR